MDKLKYDIENYGFETLHGYNFYHQKKKGLNVLQILVNHWDNNCDHKCVLVSKQYKKGMSYGIVNDVEKLNDLIINSKQKNMNLYEVLPANIPLRLYADVDAYYDINIADPEGTENSLVGDVLEVLRICLTLVFGKFDGHFDFKEDVFVCSASGIYKETNQYKVSLHICIHPSKAFKNVLDLMCFMKFVKWCLANKPTPRLAELSKELHSVKVFKNGVKEDDWGIDFRTYKAKQVFKLPYQSKSDSSRIQTPIDSKTDIKPHLCGYYGDDYKNIKGTYYDMKALEKVISTLPGTDGIMKLGKKNICYKLLEVYYSSKFPAAAIIDFLSQLCYGINISNKEIAFTTTSGAFVRHLSFKKASELQNKLKKSVPLVIHTGALYSKTTRHYNNSVNADGKTVIRGNSDIRVDKNSMVQGKEFVIDIDIKDLGSIRTCCSQDEMICSTCWGFVRCHIKALEWVCNEKLGVKVMWCFSGGKGIHGWLCDPRTGFRVTDSYRDIFADYLDFYEDSRKNGLAVRELKDSLFSSSYGRTLFEKLEPMFRSYIEIQQKVFTCDDQKAKWIEWIRHFDPKNSKDCNHVADMLSKLSISNWEDFERACKQIVPTDVHTYKRILVFKYALPVIDLKVMTDAKHLTKIPFSVHASSGMVCLPFKTKTGNEIGDLSDYLVPYEQLIELDHGSEINKRFNTATKIIKDFTSYMNKISV